ncbi:MAG: dihydroorotate dehydrogenase electron transfer subunit, partial [Duncaniella sp.]|nr:dihydroorotate dehydrogenase electron transfer subunit [Duncaniella sp.]
MKQIRDFKVKAVERYGELYALLTLHTADGLALPDCLPGQFVQVAVETPGVFLRRPISINSVDAPAGVMTLLVRDAGNATHKLINLPEGSTLNIILPLGNGFTTDVSIGSRVLLAGGGVGVAPMFYLGTELKRKGLTPEFLLGARSADQLLM